MQSTFEIMKNEIRIDGYKDFLSYERMIDRSCEMEWQDIVDKFVGTDLDPVDEAAEELERIKMYKYRMELMTIVCMYETWEQDLFNYLKEKNLLETESNEFVKTKKAIQENYGINLSNDSKLDEMRKVVNAIKHGSGSAFNQIVEILGPSVLADSDWNEIKEDGGVVKTKRIHFDSNTLTNRTLNLKGKIEEYYNGIESFWRNIYQQEKTPHNK